MPDSNQNPPPSPIHPGQLLRGMLEERGWTHEELAMITGYRRQSISSVAAERNGVSPEMAIALGAAFGNGAAQWLEWGAQYELSLARESSSNSAEGIEMMARCFSTAPIRDMWKRGWIKETTDADELNSELAIFYGQPISDVIAFPIAARNGVSVSQLSKADAAWCFRARQLANVLQVEPFRERALDSLEKKLRLLAAFPKEARRLPKVLGDHGIRFVVVELIPGATMDGAAFWIDDNPVIAVSIRHDRIDSFWFTVMHEWFHIKNRDSYSFDAGLLSDKSGVLIPTATEEAEQIANRQASDLLIPHDELQSFARRLAPIFSAARINQFANKVKIHPGIVVGQLQHIGALGYSSFREMLVKVRPIVTETALTDGWGEAISPGTI